MAITQALSILSWFELPEDDRPGEDIWLDAEALAGHFERVRRRYKAQGSGMEPVEDAPMMENELARGFRENL